MVNNMATGENEIDVLDVDILYEYGLDSAPLLAIRAPFATSADGAGLVGSVIVTSSGQRQIMAVARRTSAPIAKGEPIGVHVRPIEKTTVDAR